MLIIIITIIIIIIIIIIIRLSAITRPCVFSILLHLCLRARIAQYYDEDDDEGEEEEEEEEEDGYDDDENGCTISGRAEPAQTSSRAVWSWDFVKSSSARYTP